jgi:hypothetical protein
LQLFAFCNVTVDGLSFCETHPVMGIALLNPSCELILFGISEFGLDAWIETAIERFGLVPLEGRIAIVTNAGRDAMDADVLRTNSM